jgi:hypothetical protein
MSNSGSIGEIKAIKTWGVAVAPKKNREGNTGSLNREGARNRQSFS